MDRSEAIVKAREFAKTAYSAEMERITHEHQEKLIATRAQASAKGTLGAIAKVTAKLHAERIKALLQVRLDTLLEGYDLHRVELDDEISAHVLTDVMALHTIMVGHSASVQPVDRGAVSPGHYAQLVEQNIGLSHNAVKTQIERRRHMPMKTGASTSINIYHVNGHNNRWVTNGADHSVNVVTNSSKEIFANLRQEISSHVPAGEEQQDILERLSALENAQNTPSFAQRYTDFVAAAANHMQLIGPFIPALTEMLQKAPG